jgi:preprotein translocase subunit SecG
MATFTLVFIGVCFSFFSFKKARPETILRRADLLVGIALISISIALFYLQGTGFIEAPASVFTSIFATIFLLCGIGFIYLIKEEIKMKRQKEQTFKALKKEEEHQIKAGLQKLEDWVN